jgi:hypothetical protein
MLEMMAGNSIVAALAFGALLCVLTGLVFLCEALRKENDNDI